MYKYTIASTDEDCDDLSLLEVVVDELGNDGVEFECDDELNIISKVDLSSKFDEMKSVFSNLNYKLSLLDV